MSVWRVLILWLLVLTATACGERVDPQEPARKAPPSSSPAAAAGMCEHGIPEGLCTKCIPALAAVFQAKGDWCDEHGFPESYCPICNPNPTFPDVGTPPAAPADWCGGHGLPESKCTKCNPSLVAEYQAAGDWCEAHGFPESVCPVCNPQAPPASASGVTADWCVEHGLPESKCTKCNPALVAEYQAAGDWCDEHGFPESVCPICSPQTAPAGAEQAAIEARTVRFRSPDIEAAAGIATVTATSVQAEPSSVGCTARLAFHGDRVADVHAMVPGIVRDVRVELGDRVERGAALFELESTGVGEVQAELQTARERARTAKANLERKRELTDIASARQVELAEQELAIANAEVGAAQAALRMMGARQASLSGRYTLTAPIAGVVVRRPAVLGTLATEATSLATISDTSVMWVLCDVPESGASQISLGQKLHLSVDGDAESSFDAVITWIAAEVDPRTRTVTAHAEVPNPTGTLRANQFGRGRIDTSASRTAVSVPRAAVQRVGELDVVFVRTAEGIYEPRVVRRLAEDGDEMVQVEGRVNNGDAVVTTGAVLLRTEIMPGSIGAGCCEVEPPGDD